MTKKSVKKNQKTKIDYSSSGGGRGILSILFSCYALAALQSPTINQDIRHKTTTRSTISTLSSFNDNSMLQKEKNRQRLGGSTYTGAGRVINTTVFFLVRFVSCVIPFEFGIHERVNKLECIYCKLKVLLRKGSSLNKIDIWSDLFLIFALLL